MRIKINNITYEILYVCSESQTVVLISEIELIKLPIHLLVNRDSFKQLGAEYV